MKKFDLFVPTKVYFGNKIYKEALKKEKNTLQGKVLLVTTGRSLHRLGYVANIVDVLHEIKEVTHVEIFDQVSANPKLTEIQQGIETGIKKKASVVVGLGGGSALDAAKAIAVGIGTAQPIEDFLFHGQIPSEKTLPIIAIPTTSGTGSELSKGAIITSLEKQIKTGIRGEHIYPKAAIVDPSFTIHIPYITTMETGFDVFAHAVESYISKEATPFSKLLSEQVIYIVSTALLLLTQNLSDSEAREQMSYASMLMGMNLGNVGTALPHRLQYPIGAHTDTTHSAGLVSLYPAWVTYGYQYSASKFNKIATILSGHLCSSKDEVLQSFTTFINQLAIGKNLRQLGISDAEIEGLASQVTGNISNDPAAEESDIIRKIYTMAMN
jgi:alcohol dehydrogenase class IV